MRRFHFPLFLTCLLFPVLHASAADPPPPEIFTKITPSVVTLTAYSADGTKLGQEAGFVVEKSGVVATCFHVIAEAASIEVQSADETAHAATAVLFGDPDSDLALLKVDSLSAPPLKLGPPDAVKLDAPVAVIGNRLREATQFGQGVITSLLSPNGELNRIEFGVPISPGANGQPLVASDAGEVVGMTAYRVRAGKKSGYAIPARIIAYRLRSIGLAPGIALEDLTPEVKRQLVEERDGKVAAGECTEEHGDDGPRDSGCARRRLLDQHPSHSRLSHLRGRRLQDTLQSRRPIGRRPFDTEGRIGKSRRRRRLRQTRIRQDAQS